VRKPDFTAVITALWRAAHLRLDAPPHVLKDDIGLRLVSDTDVLTAYLGPEAAGHPDAWLAHPLMGEEFRRWRATIVARARLVEDIVAEQVDRGCDQYVILGRAHGWEPGGTMQIPDWYGCSTEYLPVPVGDGWWSLVPIWDPAQTPNPLRRWDSPVPYWARDP